MEHENYVYRSHILNFRWVICVCSPATIRFNRREHKVFESFAFASCVSKVSTYFQERLHSKIIADSNLYGTKMMNYESQLVEYLVGEHFVYIWVTSHCNSFGNGFEFSMELLFLFIFRLTRMLKIAEVSVEIQTMPRGKYDMIVLGTFDMNSFRDELSEI